MTIAIVRAPDHVANSIAGHAGREKAEVWAVCAVGFPGTALCQAFYSDYVTLMSKLSVRVRVAKDCDRQCVPIRCTAVRLIEGAHGHGTLLHDRSISGQVDQSDHIADSAMAARLA